jgi:hypothetical protein
MPDFYASSGVLYDEIKTNEKSLNLVFSDEYRSYVAAFGFASADGHELTGVCKFPRLSVVVVTQSEREANPSVPVDWYVLEQANIDGIVVWQSGTGEVFQTMPNTAPIKLCDSLAEYLDL